MDRESTLLFSLSVVVNVNNLTPTAGLLTARNAVLLQPDMPPHLDRFRFKILYSQEMTLLGILLNVPTEVFYVFATKRLRHGRTLCQTQMTVS
jgi:hypothetical protein